MTHPASESARPAHSSGEVIAVADAFLMDMDGTLVDSGDSVVRIWNRVFEEFGTEERFGPHLHGVPARGIAERVFGHIDPSLPQRVLERSEQLEVEDAHTAVELPGARAFLEDLEAASAELGRDVWTIVTSCTAPLFRARYDHLGMPMPAQWVTVDQVERGKPHPDPFLLGAERLGADPARCIVVEDAVSGLTAARAAGATGIGLATHSPHTELAPHALTVVDSLADLTVRVRQDRLGLVRR